MFEYLGLEKVVLLGVLGVVKGSFRVFFRYFKGVWYV